MEVFTAGGRSTRRSRQRRRGLVEQHVGLVDNLRSLLTNNTLLGFQNYTQTSHISFFLPQSLPVMALVVAMAVERVLADESARELNRCKRQ